MSEIERVFKLFMTGDYTQKDLANKLGRSLTWVNNVLNRKTYKKVKLSEEILNFIKKTNFREYGTKIRDSREKKKPDIDYQKLSEKTRKFGPEVWQEMYEEYKKGQTVPSLSKVYNCSETLIINCLKKINPAYSGRKKYKKYNTEKFIIESFEIHGDKYDYSLVNYQNLKTKVGILCPEHGVFQQSPASHLKGGNCPKCYYRSRGERSRGSKESILKRFEKAHGDIYDYSQVDYTTVHEKVKIICKKHGVWETTANNHANGHGCPRCKESKGEKQIREFLEEKGINFETEKYFEDIKHPNPLYFDFYLPNKEILIEYDGEQHFKDIEFFGGESGLMDTVLRDIIKNQYADNSDMTLYRIKYTDDIQ